MGILILLMMYAMVITIVGGICFMIHPIFGALVASTMILAILS
jgi:hypothetical protein